WTPWNMTMSRGRAIVWDWERFQTGIPVGYDAIHYRLQDAVIRDGSAAQAAAEAAVTGAAAALIPLGVAPHTTRRVATLYVADIRDRRRDPTLRHRPSARAFDPRLRRPVFVIGAPRSGTTFLGSCLGRLPEISYHFEPRLTKAAARCVYDGSWSTRRGRAVFR